MTGCDCLRKKKRLSARLGRSFRVARSKVANCRLPETGKFKKSSLRCPEMAMMDQSVMAVALTLWFVSSLDKRASSLMVFVNFSEAVYSSRPCFVPNDILSHDGFLRILEKRSTL